MDPSSSSASPISHPKPERPALPLLHIEASSSSTETPQKAHNFIIPTITITRPMNSHRYSPSIPEQKYDKSVLFVPVKTEELGWDENGLYWNGTYAYPVHNVYNRDGKSIGRRRNGPEGYRFYEMFDGCTPPCPQADTNESDDESSPSSTAEEAKFNLKEPAPATSSPEPVVVVEEPECLSPTMSACSTDSESDATSLWSRRDSTGSACTSPGTLTPPEMELDAEHTADDSLKLKLAKGWTPLGTMPARRPLFNQRSQSTPSRRSSSSSSSQRFSSSSKSNQSNRSLSTPTPRPRTPAYLDEYSAGWAYEQGFA